jgi:outer membrane lipoprotein SlyB
MLRKTLRRRIFGRINLLLAAWALTGCAARTLPAPTAETSPLAGRLSLGTVVSVRNITFENGDPTVSQILAALGTASPARRGAAVEIVIRRQDNSIASLVQRPQLPQAQFVPGEHVTIVEAAATVIRPE